MSSRHLHGQTDMRGLSTAGRSVRSWSGAAGLESERHPRGELLIVSYRVTPHVFADPTPFMVSAASGGHSCMIARGQHQPASSRAIATFAMVLFLRRVRNFTHCRCRRSFPTWVNCFRATVRTWWLVFESQRARPVSGDVLGMPRERSTEADRQVASSKPARVNRESLGDPLQLL